MPAALAGASNVTLKNTSYLRENNAMRKHRSRRGMSNFQYVFVAALIILVVVASITLMGSRTNTKLNQTASDVANPAALTQRFGS